MEKELDDANQIGEHIGYLPSKCGPFRCDHCTYFVRPFMCKHPEVVAEPKMKKVISEGKTFAGVEPGACCNEFHPDRAIDSVPFGAVGL